MRKIKSEYLIAILGFILFVPFLGNVHLFDWDEINFAESAREMMVTGEYFKVQINFETFWEKPPFFFWLQVLSMKLFGINEFAARFPNALIGIATLIIIFRIGRKHVNESFAWIWVLVYAGSFLPHFYFRSGIIDPTFNLFIFLSIYYWALASSREAEWPHIYLAGFFGGMATLTKGPVGVLIVGLCVLIYWAYKRDWSAIKWSDIFKYAAVVLFVSFAWFGVEFIKNGPYFIQEFITYQIRLFKTQDAGHGGPFYYHALVLLLGCFPISFFTIQGLFKKPHAYRPFQQLYLWSKISFWVVLILFSIVNTKIVHYSSFCYFPITLIGAWVVYKQSINRQLGGNSLIRFLFSLTGGLIAAVFVLLPIAMYTKTSWMNQAQEYVQDPFAWANLHAPVYWGGYEWIGGVVLFAGLVFYGFKMKRDPFEAILVLFVTVILSIELVLPLVVPKVEGFSQREAISFYESIAQEDKYVYVHGFKSYAHLFYAKVMPQKNAQSKDFQWLLNGPVDKPTYFVSKIGTDEDKELKNAEKLVPIGGEYGFHFYKRK
jgi:4-amino-4-deoxy-L-arabinose transferase-like glycosyltransferase